ncbi:MAG: HigA family addiction module antitoxin [Candidatus Helarchaeota archaeon]|nr:HigA family addiction module antitoxin [Candidatus Helarchaeota archaeon]
MVMEKKDFRTPGQLIGSLLSEHGWTQRLLAVILGMDETGINHIVLGKRAVSAEMAVLLEEVFKIPAETFLTLQKQYDLARARIVARPDPNRAIRTYLFGSLPITEMIKRRWLDGSDIRNVKQIENALVTFFGVNSVDEIEILPHAAKKTNTFVPVTPVQLVWIYRAKQIANDMLAGRYSPSAVKSAIPRLNNLLSAPEEARKVPKILAQCGIRYVIVETLAKAKIDGVCFWLNDFSPVIGMSLRYDRIDNFWFVLRHELEHVLRRHGLKAIMVDAELEEERANTRNNTFKEEQVANEAAEDFCVSRKKMDSFIARKAPFFYERDILGLASVLQIHPGLVAGQLQHRTGKYDRFREHLVKIRNFVTSGAMVDGWGDVAPVGL